MAQTKAEINNKLPPSVKYSASQYDIATELGYGKALYYQFSFNVMTGQDKTDRLCVCENQAPFLGHGCHTQFFAFFAVGHTDRCFFFGDLFNLC